MSNGLKKSAARFSTKGADLAIPGKRKPAKKAASKKVPAKRATKGADVAIPGKRKAVKKAAAKKAPAKGAAKKSSAKRIASKRTSVRSR